MKLIFSTLFVLMAVAVSSAHYVCGPSVCGVNYSCVYDGSQHMCHLGCGVTLQQHIVNEWTDGNTNQHFVQVQVTIHNYGPRAVTNVIIGAGDGTLRLRDQTRGSIWNIECAGADLTLPSHSSTLNCGQTFTFGYINRDCMANLYIKSVHVL